MIIPTAATTIRWLRMTQVKNCHKLNHCKCADDLRRILLKIPISEYDEQVIERDINLVEKKYNLCFHEGEEK
tara:strand:- start:78 stop:293 length:216 start_codon:yes stop_codon:yes gene_type:complete